MPKVFGGITVILSGDLPGANKEFKFGQRKVLTMFRDIKIVPNYLIPAHTIVGREDNICFQGTLKQSISKLNLPEKTLKGVKTFFCLIKFLRLFQNFWIWVWGSRCPLALWAMQICQYQPLFTPTASKNTKVLEQLNSEQFIVRAEVSSKDVETFTFKIKLPDILRLSQTLNLPTILKIFIANFL